MPVQNESAQTFVRKFEAKVARFVNQKNASSQADCEQWELLLSKNSKLTAETGNDITFQLTTTASMWKSSHQPTTIEFSSKVIDKFIRKLEKDETRTIVKKIGEARVIIIEIKKRSIDAGDQPQVIKFSEAINALKQVTNEIEKCRTHIVGSFQSPRACAI